jgi:chorismate mutase/prephenate dehydratase
MKIKKKIDFPQRLNDKRKKIDLIDKKMLSLLNRRLRMAREVGKIKREMGENIYDPKREREVLEKLKIKNRGLLKNKDIMKIFGAIMKVCRQSQA